MGGGRGRWGIGGAAAAAAAAASQGGFEPRLRKRRGSRLQRVLTASTSHTDAGEHVASRSLSLAGAPRQGLSAAGGASAFCGSR